MHSNANMQHPQTPPPPPPPPPTDLALHSDCKQRVYQLFYTDSFTPDLYLRQFGQYYISLKWDWGKEPPSRV